MLISRPIEGGAPAVANRVHLHLPPATVDLIATGRPSSDPAALLHRHDDGSVTVTTMVVGQVKIRLAPDDYTMTQQQAQQALA